MRARLEDYLRDALDPRLLGDPVAPQTSVLDALSFDGGGAGFAIRPLPGIWPWSLQQIAVPGLVPTFFRIEADYHFAAP